MGFLKQMLGFGKDPREAVRPLWHASVAAARREHWYRECGVADSVAGRFDMITAVLAMVLLRMEQSEALMTPSVHLTELFIDDMDGQLRESGVGDVVVGKKMGRLMSVMGGRLGAYREALAGGTDDLANVAERNIEFADGGDPECVAKGLRQFSLLLAQSEDEAILGGNLPDV